MSFFLQVKLIGLPKLHSAAEHLLPGDRRPPPQHDRSAAGCKRAPGVLPMPELPRCTRRKKVALREAEKPRLLCFQGGRFFRRHFTVRFVCESN